MLRYGMMFRIGTVLVAAFLSLYLWVASIPVEVKAAENVEEEIPVVLGVTVIPGVSKPVEVVEEEVKPGEVEPIPHLERREDSVTSVNTFALGVYDVYGEDALELLAITIFCEAGGDEASDETRRMVGEVVLNRVASERFPDTIKSVLLSPSQYGTFAWTGVVWPTRAYSENEAYAVERAYKCAEMVLFEERLLPTDVVWQAEFPQGHECVVRVPGFYFCR